MQQLLHEPSSFGLKLNSPNADIYVSGGGDLETALRRVTHLAIVSHQDDIEIMAPHGILECYRRPGRWFGGVVLSDSERVNPEGTFSHLTPQQTVKMRRQEQRNASDIGEYSVQLQIGYHKKDILDRNNQQVVADLITILSITSPEVVYVHNPLDGHATQLATYIRSMQALRSLPEQLLPKEVYGCEVRRELDSCRESGLVVGLPVPDPDGLIPRLIRAHASQLGVRDYEDATLGLQRANPVLFFKEPRGSPPSTLAVRLTPLIRESRELGLKAFEHQLTQPARIIRDELYNRLL